MSFKIINTANTGINNGFALISNNPINNQQYFYNPTSPDSTGFFVDSERYGRGFISLGSGVIITTSAQSLYDSQTVGSGAVDKFVVINRSDTTAFVGINSYTMNMQNGIPIGSGESYCFNNIVRNVWAVTSGGVAVIAGGGPLLNNYNAI